VYLAQPTQDVLRAVLRSCRRHFIDAAAFSAFLNLLYLAPTLYMLQIYDRVVPTRGHLTLWLLTVVMFFAVGVLSLLDLARSRLMVRASMRLDRQLAGPILESTLARRTGGRSGLTKQAMREFDTLRQTLTGPAMLALFDAPWTPIYIAVCFLLHPLLGVVTLAGTVILALISVLNDRATRAKNRDHALSPCQNGAAATGRKLLLHQPADFPGRCSRCCIEFLSVISKDYSSLLLKSEPEFHAEWLRDGPCDATTTGPSNSGHRCQLSPAVTSGVHEIRGAGCIASRGIHEVPIVAVARRHAPVFVFAPPPLSKRGLNGCCIRTAMSGMREAL